jgi:hypothetical protein
MIVGTGKRKRDNELMDFFALAHSFLSIEPEEEAVAGTI